MSFSLPIIGPNRYAVPEFLIDGVTGKFSGPTVENIASAISYCIESPDRAARMGKAGRQLQQTQFRWAHVVNRLVLDVRLAGRDDQDYASTLQKYEMESQT
jgi:glycosyltransferase involved in cell wall biosynthesis